MTQAGATFGSVMLGLGQSILNVFINLITTIVAQWLLGFLMAIIGAKTTDKIKILGTAPVAGAYAYTSVMASVPFPANLAMAPVVAGIAKGQVVAMAASAGGYWNIPEQTIAMLHPKETVLPAWAAQRLDNMLAGGGVGGGVAGGVTTVNAPISITINPRQEMTQSDYHKHARMLTRALNRELSRFGKNPLGPSYA